MTKLEFIKKVESLSENDFSIELIRLLVKELYSFEIQELIELSVKELARKYYDAHYNQSLFKEQLQMTKSYLKGEMYTDKETAEKMLQRQIENIEDVLRLGGKL